MYKCNILPGQCLIKEGEVQCQKQGKQSVRSGILGGNKSLRPTWSELYILQIFGDIKHLAFAYCHSPVNEILVHYRVTHPPTQPLSLQNVARTHLLNWVKRGKVEQIFCVNLDCQIQ